MAGTERSGVEFSSFYESFSEMASRMSPSKVIVDTGHFVQQQQYLGFNRVKSLLSVGPGPGLHDIELLSHMPQCRIYIGLEPDDVYRQTLQQSLKERFLSLECQVYSTKAEEWEGPEERVDVVFASHVFYHFPDTKSVLQRMLTWLRPGGLLLIVHGSNISEWRKYMVKAYDSILSDRVDQAVKELSLTVTYEALSHFTLDTRNKTRALANFLTQKDTTDEEYEDVIRYLETTFRNQPLVPSANKIWVIRKELQD